MSTNQNENANLLKQRTDKIKEYKAVAKRIQQSLLDAVKDCEADELSAEVEENKILIECWGKQYVVVFTLKIPGRKQKSVPLEAKLSLFLAVDEENEDKPKLLTEEPFDALGNVGQRYLPEECGALLLNAILKDAGDRDETIVLPLDEDLSRIGSVGPSRKEFDRGG